MNNINTSQDPEYVGPTGHEKKFHKTHFHVKRALRKRTRVQDDPDWYEYAPGKWRKYQKEDEEKENE